jgi:hypothetical protein
MSSDYVLAFEVLEEQKMHLQSLAMKENTAKGFAELELKHPVSTELESVKKNTCTMLQEIWNRNSKKRSYTVGVRFINNVYLIDLTSLRQIPMFRKTLMRIATLRVVTKSFGTSWSC